MANTFKPKDYGHWNVWKESYSVRELRNRRVQLAKAANTRLRRLEKSTTISGKSMIDMPWFDTITGALEIQGRIRFSESYNVDKTITGIKNEITALETFLSMKSSTVGGFRQVEEQRVQSLVDAGLPEEVARHPNFYEFVSSETFASLVDTSLSSEDIMEFFETGQEEGLTVDEIIAEFEEFDRNSSAGWKGMLELLKSHGEIKRKGYRDRRRNK